MQMSNQEVERLVRQGYGALQAGRPDEARRSFEEALERALPTAQLWLLLATACRASGDAKAEEAALDALIAAEPRVPRAHVMKADCRARAGDERTAASFYKSALRLAEGQRLPDDLMAELRRAEEALARIEAGIEAKREAMLTVSGLPPEKRSRRFQQALDISAGRKRIFVQEPTAFYLPELPQIQYYDPADFAWRDEVEAATDAILVELKALLSGDMSGFRPYIRSDPNQPRLDDNRLLDSQDWSALFLAENGMIAEEVVERCPVTWRALQAAGLPRIEGSAPTVMFSLLRAGAHIAPHTGMHNARLTCHLPLIVPPGCGFRVGNEVREWEVGKLLIFDDTIEHEAWNRGSEDRVVLIFDIWRPELTDQEKTELSILFSSSAAG